MNEAAKRATVYFEPELHMAICLKAVETNQSLSEIVTTPIHCASSSNLPVYSMGPVAWPVGEPPSGSRLMAYTALRTTFASYPSARCTLTPCVSTTSQ